MLKFEVNTEAMTGAEALSLVIFLVELYNLPRTFEVAQVKDAPTFGVDSNNEHPDAGRGNAGTGALAGSASPAANPEGQRNKKSSGKVGKPTASFILRNEKTGVEIRCDTGRTGEVDIARGHLETWLRDAETVEEIERLAKMAEPFSAILSGKEQRALARIIAEVLRSFEGDGSTAEDEEMAEDGGQQATPKADKSDQGTKKTRNAKASGGDASATEGTSGGSGARTEKPRANGADAPERGAHAESTEGKATAASIREAGKDLANAKGIAAVTTILAKFDARSFTQVKPEQFEELYAELKEGMN